MIQIEQVDPAELHPAEYNPREITDDALQRLAKLLDAHGFVDPIIARREDGLVIGGHQRLRANAMRAKPDKKVPVVYLEGLSDDQAKALNIALNNPAAQGDFNPPKLADLLQSIDAADFDVPMFTAFSAEDLAEMLQAGQQATEGEWGAAIGNVPEGGHCGLQTMTFILAVGQVEDVKAALTTAKAAGPFVDTGNENSNGNALARIVEAYRGAG